MYLKPIARPTPAPASAYCQSLPSLVGPEHRPGGDRHRQERADVGDRDARVDDRQEREAEDRGGGQADAVVGTAALVAPQRPADEPGGDDADHRQDRGGGARGVPDRRRVEGELAGDARLRSRPGRIPRIAVAQLQDPEDDVGERRRVLEVARVEVAREERDGAVREVRRLVVVVDVGQPVVVVLHPQVEADDDDQREDRQAQREADPGAPGRGASPDAARAPAGSGVRPPSAGGAVWPVAAGFRPSRGRARRRRGGVA